LNVRHVSDRTPDLGKDRGDRLAPRNDHPRLRSTRFHLAGMLCREREDLILCLSLILFFC
jgi:hypothetical protein